MTDLLEDQRLAALHRLELLDTPPERGFDEIVTLATQICRTNTGLISLLDGKRQWFKARKGFDARETPISHSVCAHAILESEILVVPDLTRDARTRENPLVTGAPFIRFYAGAVVRMPEGHAVGTLCVIDQQPRPDGLTDEQRTSLLILARQVSAQLELRRALTRRAVALDDARDANVVLEQQVASRREADVLQTIVNGELSHRLKNILAIVQAIASQTLRNASDIAVAREALSSRLVALGRAQDVLLSGDTRAAGIAPIVRGCVAMLDDAILSRFRLNGPPVDVGPKAALAVALMVHELATNAAKYGALSVEAGSVDVIWSVSTGADPTFRLVWDERDGPPVVTPERTGFGSKMIERAVAGTIGSRVKLDYLPTGVRCELIAPLTALQEQQAS